MKKFIDPNIKILQQNFLKEFFKSIKSLEKKEKITI
jgi:hypothetical protein